MNMQCTIKDFAMSFDFSNINPINKAQASYKDGSGMGGGGMYFRQGKKRKDEPDEDMFDGDPELHYGTLRVGICLLWRNKQELQVFFNL